MDNETIIDLELENYIIYLLALKAGKENMGLNEYIVDIIMRNCNEVFLRDILTI